MALKDHQIAKLTNDIRDTLLIKMNHIRFPDSLRGIISTSVVRSLSSMNAREDHRDGPMHKYCIWIRAFDGNFNIGCVNQTGKRANGDFKQKYHGATWEFMYCPYCGKRIQHPNKQAV